MQQVWKGHETDPQRNVGFETLRSWVWSNWPTKRLDRGLGACSGALDRGLDFLLAPNQLC